MFPLSTVLFPGAALPLHVFEERYRVLTTRCLEGDREFGVVLIGRGPEVGGGDRRLDVGVVARIDEASALPDGRFVLITTGTDRFCVTEWLPDDPHPLALVEVLGPSPGPGGDVAGALTAAASSVRRSRALLSELGQGPALGHLELDGDPDAASWRLCEAAPVGTLDRQHLLETADLLERILLVQEMADAMSEDLHRLLAEGG